MGVDWTREALGFVQLWKYAERTLMTTFEHFAEFHGAAKSLAFSSDGETLAAASAGNGSIMICSVQHAQRMRTLIVADWCPFNSILFSSDGSFFMAGSSDGVKVWDTKTWLRQNSFGDGPCHSFGMWSRGPG